MRSFGSTADLYGNTPPGKAGGVPRRICFDAHVKTAAANAAAALARFKCLWSNPMGSELVKKVFLTSSQTRTAGWVRV